MEFGLAHSITTFGVSIKHHITDITIPNVIPPPIESDANRNRSHKDTNMAEDAAEKTAASEGNENKNFDNC